MTLTWTVEFDDRARRELRKLDKSIQKKVLKYLRERIATDDDPRRFGKPLSYDKYGLWRYRVENIRLVCEIEDDIVNVLIVRIGLRKDVYNS